MTARKKPFFEGGSHIAMKVPPYLFAETVGFYKEVLPLPENSNGFWICNPVNIIHLVSRDG